MAPVYAKTAKNILQLYEGIAPIQRLVIVRDTLLPCPAAQAAAA